MTKISDLHRGWMQDPEYRAEYEKTQPVYDLMHALVSARVSSGLTQAQIAERMATTQSAVARLEGWTANPSVNTLRRFAEATGTRLRISFEAIGAARTTDDESETFADNAATEESVEAEKVEPAPVST